MSAGSGGTDVIPQHIAATMVAFLAQATQPTGDDAIKQEIEKSVAQQIARNIGQPGHHSWPGTSPVALTALVAILVPLGFFALVVLSIWLLGRNSRAKAQARAEFYRQVLDKFSSGREFGDFLGSRGSERLLEGLWSERLNAKEKIVRGLGTGVVLAVLGLGALALSWKTSGFIYPAVLLLALGIGFLISSGVSYRLSKTWGLLRDDQSGFETEAMLHK
jgi:hypothetical protein